MTVAKILKISYSCKKSLEDAVNQGIARASETLPTFKVRACQIKKWWPATTRSPSTASA